MARIPVKRPMSKPHSIDNVESLRSALREVLEEAQTNDVEIEGSLRIQTPSDHSVDYELQIWEIE